MKGELIYLARPVDLVAKGDKDAQWLLGTYHAVKSELTACGFVTYDPSAAFTLDPEVPTEPQRWLQEVNRAAMYRAAGMVALLPAGVSTLGTPMEIFEAVRVGKSVAILTDIEGSWTLAGLIGNNVRTFPLTGNGANGAVAWLRARETPPEAGNRARRDVIDVVLGEGGVLPTRGYAGDAGFDLHVVGNHWVKGNTFVDVPCCLKLGLPGNMWGLITGRSSTLRRRGLMVVQGVIDSGYRGDIYTGVWNLGTADVFVEDGERLAQLIPFYNVANSVDLAEVDNLLYSERGEQGFGSTGT